MPKKFKKSASRRQAGTAHGKRAVKATAARKRRPNAKVVGKPARPKRRKPATARRPAPTEPREEIKTESAPKRRTRAHKTAPELGVESHEPRQLPVVAIVGRPNVGKSSLFNKLAGSRIAIEDPRPGTTRDRVSMQVRLKDANGKQRVVELFDTAGIGMVDEESVQEHVYEQIENAISSADVVLFVADVREGVLALDLETAAALRRSRCKVVLVANKADAPALDKHATDLFELGLGEPLVVSAKTARNLRALRERVCAELPPRSRAENIEPPELLLAVVGRRNVGKSTLVNALANDERVIASELEGTTRDSVDVRFSYDGKTFVAIDTAGVRRRQTLQHSVEFFSQSRSFRAVRRASVTVLMLDAREPITRIDTQLVTLAIEESKPLIIAVNKWDLVKGHTTDEFETYLRKKLHAVAYAPIVFMSAVERQNVFALVDLARELHAQAGFRVGTGELNRLVHAAFDRHHPQPRKNKLGRIFYATQVQTYPPQVVVFVNDPELFPENWRMYLMRQLQERSEFGEVPLRLKFKAREKVMLE
jgi:GTPase